MVGKTFKVMALVVLAAGCGKGTQTASGTKIVGGTKASSSSAVTRSTVALLQPGGWQFCSGTLIDSRHVVTAGHCIAKYTDDSMFVYFGLDSANASKQTADTIAVSKMTPHPDYSEDPMQQEPAQTPPNDISILELSTDAPKGYSPVSILPTDDDLAIGESLTLAGFGLTTGNGTDHGVLRQVNVPLDGVNSVAKEISYGKGANGKGSCEGDSGGPAYVTRNHQLVLVGATSRGDSSCTENGIYTDVRQFTDWLTSEGASI